MHTSPYASKKLTFLMVSSRVTGGIPAIITLCFARMSLAKSIRFALS